MQTLSMALLLLMLLGAPAEQRHEVDRIDDASSNGINDVDCEVYMSVIRSCQILCKAPSTQFTVPSSCNKSLL